MKKTVTPLLGMLASALVAMTAHAAPLNFEYTATVRAIFSSNPSDSSVMPSSVDSASILGYSVANGARVKGRFVYDSGMARTPLTQYEIPDQLHWYEDSRTNSAAAAFDGGLSFHSAATPDGWMPSIRAQVANNWNGDMFTLFGFGFGADGSQQSTYLSLQDPAGTAFDTADLPALLDIDAFQHKVFQYSFTSGDFQTSYALHGEIMSLTAVPEPASALLVLSGLGLLAAASRRRKAERP